MGKEVGLALDGKLPELVTQDDLRGVLHAHTTESDGSDSLEDMAEATRQRGYAYLGLTDHSQSAHYAGGLKVARRSPRNSARSIASTSATAPGSTSSRASN